MEQGIILAIILGMIAGGAVAFQGALNTLLSKTVGIWEANLFVHLSGAVLLILLLVFGLGQGSLIKITTAPKISLIGGMLGVLVVSGSIVAITKLGVSMALALLILAQLIAAATIDHYGWLGTEQISFSIQRGIAIALLLVGAILMRR
ncbi:MAG: DMT family transporter [Bacillota bacterium]|nr:DMT family transporter [Bacillota bacterium]